MLQISRAGLLIHTLFISHTLELQSLGGETGGSGMENAMSTAVKWLSRGLAAIVLVCLYAVGMIATAPPAAAHGWHCGWVRGHRHLGACDVYYDTGWWWGGRRGRRGRGRRGRR
jgi:hypothetical protein